MAARTSSHRLTQADNALKEASVKPTLPISARVASVLGLLAGIPIILLGISSLLWESLIYSVFGSSIGSSIESLVITGGLYLALPLGLIDVIAGVILARSRMALRRGLAYLVLGLVGILVGVFWWWVVFILS